MTEPVAAPVIELLSEAEVAAMLRRSRRYVRQLRQAGELRWLPGAGRAPILIDKASVLAYVERTLQWRDSPSVALRAVKTPSTTSPEAARRRELTIGKMLFRRKAATASRP